MSRCKSVWMGLANEKLISKHKSSNLSLIWTLLREKATQSVVRGPETMRQSVIFKSSYKNAISRSRGLGLKHLGFDTSLRELLKR
jgi:hypothetical protein